MALFESLAEDMSDEYQLGVTLLFAAMSAVLVIMIVLWISTVLSVRDSLLFCACVYIILGGLYFGHRRGY